MRFRPPYFRASQSAFTMVEIAISLAVIGVALVAIIGVLPLGMNVQRDNREGTIINQDATVFMDAISKGARGLNDLTNYVYAIVNTGSNPVGYTNALAGQMGFSIANYPSVVNWLPLLTSGSNIVGLLSTPEFVYVTAGGTHKSVPNINFGGVSNHIYAYVRSISGSAGEKPPQDNAIIQQDSFGYRILFVSTPSPMDTNLFYLHPLWQAQSYNKGDAVFFDWNYWQASQNTSATDVPGESNLWGKMGFYPLDLMANQQEFRLTFQWPILPNGNPGAGRQTYRALVAGQIETNNFLGQTLYFFQPQSFANSP